MSSPIGTKSSKDKHNGQAKGISYEQPQRPTLSGPQDDVLNLQRTAGNRAVTQLLQSSADSPHSVEGVPPIVRSVLNSGGQPLNPIIREYMESRFSHDFSNVRIHTDDKAAKSADEVNAVAYTVGRNIVFGDSSYSPYSIAGKRVLAHELAHVVQQRIVRDISILNKKDRPKVGTTPMLKPKGEIIYNNHLSFDKKKLNEENRNRAIDYVKKTDVGSKLLKWLEDRSINITVYFVAESKDFPDLESETAAGYFEKVAPRRYNVYVVAGFKTGDFVRTSSRSLELEWKEKIVDLDSQSIAVTLFHELLHVWFANAFPEAEIETGHTEKVEPTVIMFDIKTYDEEEYDPEFLKKLKEFDAKIKKLLKEEKKEKPATIQPKLKIGKSDNVYEQEADRVAEQVMRMPEPQFPECEEEEKILQTKEVSGQTSTLQATPNIESHIQYLKVRGQRILPLKQSPLQPQGNHVIQRQRKEHRKPSRGAGEAGKQLTISRFENDYHTVVFNRPVSLEEATQFIWRFPPKESAITPDPAEAASGGYQTRFRVDVRFELQWRLPGQITHRFRQLSQEILSKIDIPRELEKQGLPPEISQTAPSLPDGLYQFDGIWMVHGKAFPGEWLVRMRNGIIEAWQLKPGLEAYIEALDGDIDRAKKHYDADMTLENYVLRYWEQGYPLDDALGLMRWEAELDFKLAIWGAWGWLGGLPGRIAKTPRTRNPRVLKGPLESPPTSVQTKAPTAKAAPHGQRARLPAEKPGLVAKEASRRKPKWATRGGPPSKAAEQRLRATGTEGPTAKEPPLAAGTAEVAETRMVAGAERTIPQRPPTPTAGSRVRPTIASEKPGEPPRPPLEFERGLSKPSFKEVSESPRTLSEHIEELGEVPTPGEKLTTRRKRERPLTERAAIAKAGTQIEGLGMNAWKQRLGPDFKIISNKQFPSDIRAAYRKEGVKGPDGIAIGKKELIVGDVTTKPTKNHEAKTKRYRDILELNLPQRFKGYKVRAQEIWWESKKGEFKFSEKSG